MIQLWKTTSERETWETKANLWSIVKAATYLEKLYAADSISESEYHKEMYKLITHYKISVEALGHYNISLDEFLKQYDIEKLIGYQRLKKGFPAIQQQGNSAEIIAQTTQYYITLMDSLKLNLVAVDEIQPLVKDLTESLHRCDLHEFKVQSIEHWLEHLNGLKASDELGTSEVRQLTYDVETSYSNFFQALK